VTAFTLVTAVAAGAVAWTWAEKTAALVFSSLMLFVALAPALYGLLGLLYLPAALLLLGAAAARR
jgi:hypothetical protein